MAKFNARDLSQGIGCEQPAQDVKIAVVDYNNGCNNDQCAVIPSKASAINARNLSSGSGMFGWDIINNDPEFDALIVLGPDGVQGALQADFLQSILKPGQKAAADMPLCLSDGTPNVGTIQSSNRWFANNKLVIGGMQLISPGAPGLAIYTQPINTLRINYDRSFKVTRNSPTVANTFVDGTCYSFPGIVGNFMVQYLLVVPKKVLDVPGVLNLSLMPVSEEVASFDDFNYVG